MQYDNKNSLAPLSATTSGIPGALGSTVSGTIAGSAQAGKISSALKELECGRRDTLLRALQVIADGLKIEGEEPILGNNLFPEMLQKHLARTNNTVGTVVLAGLFAPVCTASHLSQLPMDVAVCVEAILKSANIKDFSQTEQASTLKANDDKTGFFANCQFLLKNSGELSDNIRRHIEDHFKDHGTAGKTHSFAARTLSTTGVGLIGGTIATVDSVIDAIGATFREMTAMVNFLGNETNDVQEKNIYDALGKCCQSISKSKNSRESLDALIKLEKALVNFEEANKMADKNVVSSPVSLVASRIVTFGPFLESLRAFNSASIATGEAHKALSQEKDNFSQRTKESAGKASLLKDFSEGDVVNHSQNVTDFCHQFDRVVADIDNNLQADNLPDRQSIGGTAASTVRGHSAVLMASSLVTALGGMISRELSGSIDFTKNDKGTKAECKKIFQSDSNVTGADLDKLMSRVCDLHERLERCHELGVSAPLGLGVSEAVSAGSLITTLNMFAGMISALRELRTISQSPSIPVQLNDAEKKAAADSVESVKKTNRNTAGSIGTGDASNNLTAEQALQSVMEKVVLMQRSYNNFLNPRMPRDDINYSGKSTIAFSQGNSTGFTLGFLGILALIGVESGISVQALFAGLRISTLAKRLSAGPDKTASGNGSEFNASSLSNANRLTGQSCKDSSLSQTSTASTYMPLESTFSRSLIVAMCHSGALKEILKRLSEEEDAKIQDAPGHLRSAVTTFKVMPHLYDRILKVLNDAQKDQNQIPGLNGDMASSLASVSNATLASALASHSSLISPFLKSTVAARKASVIKDEHKNEGLSGSELSEQISQCLNAMQAFTINSKAETKNIDNPFKEEKSMASIDSSSAQSMIAACATSLLIEELFEMCVSRSVGLWDKDKLDKSTKETKEQTKKEAEVSRNEVAADSGSNEKGSVTHVTSALRLTLSHLGVSLGNLACQIERHPALLKDNLEIHTSQAHVLRTMVSTLTHCASAMTTTAAFLSDSPMLSAGSIESLRETLHSTDKCLVIEPIDSSQRSTMDGSSEISLITGVSTDCVTSILCTVIKLLLEGSILGLDTSLSVAKIMEILCIHPRPLEAFALELEALSQPNGIERNTHLQTVSTLVAASLGLGAVTIATNTKNSESFAKILNSLQQVMDERIDRQQMLKDEEEKNPDEKNILGLKRFYAILLSAISGDLGNNYQYNHDDDSRQQEDFYAKHKETISRLNRGGFALSSYHREHGGLVGSKSSSRKDFHGCDDAKHVLNTFIAKAFDDRRSQKPLLSQVASELKKSGKLSNTVKNRWEYIVKEVISRMQEEDTRNNILEAGKRDRVKRNYAAIRKELLDDVFDVVEFNPLYANGTQTTAIASQQSDDEFRDAASTSSNSSSSSSSSSTGSPAMQSAQEDDPDATELDEHDIHDAHHENDDPDRSGEYDNNQASPKFT